MSAFSVSGLLGRYASRLATGPLLIVVVALFIISMVVPDPLPFVDEILLGLAALMLARRKGRTVPDTETNAEGAAADVESGPNAAGGRTVEGEARATSR